MSASLSVLVAISPVALAVVVVLVLKQTAMRAGLMGLAAVCFITQTVPRFALDGDGILEGAIRGFFTTLPVAYVLFGGVLLYHVLREGDALATLSNTVVTMIPEPMHRLFAMVFGLSVFFESATGFGVGIIVIVPLFVALGFAPLQAATLALIGQCAVPWGALAVGTVLGGELADESPVRLAELAVPLSFPYILASGLVALVVAKLWRGSLAQIGWLVLYSTFLCAALWLSSVLVSVELGGCMAGLLLVLLAFICARTDTVRLAKSRPSLSMSIAPFVVLLAGIGFTRLVPALEHLARSFAVIEVERYGFSLAVAHHAGTWLVLAALAGMIVLRFDAERLRALVPMALRQWSFAALAVAVFVCLGQLMVVADMTGHVAGALSAMSGNGYIAIAPMIGALGGFLTASNAASNAMFMSFQMQASAALSLPSDLMAATQNAAGANMTLASPGRLVLAASVCGERGAESALLRRVAPLAVFGVLSGVIMTLVLAYGAN